MTSPREAQGVRGGAALRAAEPHLGTQRMNARKRAPPAIVLQPRPQHSPLGPRTGSCCPAGPAPLPCAPEVLCGRCCSAARRRVDLLSGVLRVLLLLPPRCCRRPSDSSFCRSQPPRQEGPRQLSGRSQLSRGFGSPRGGGPACGAGERCPSGPPWEGSGPPGPRRGCVWAAAGGGPGSGPGRRDCTSRVLPGDELRDEPRLESGRNVRRCADEITPESGRLRRGLPSLAPPQAGLVGRSPRGLWTASPRSSPGRCPRPGGPVSAVPVPHSAPLPPSLSSTPCLY